jgi:hypothetical protein
LKETLSWSKVLTMIKKIILTAVLSLAMARPLAADDSLSYTGKVSSRGVDWVGYLAFGIDTADGTVSLAYSQDYPLTEAAAQSLAIVPDWVRADLRDAYSLLTAERQDLEARALLDLTDPRTIDEVAFTFAHMGPLMVEYSEDYLDAVVENAEWIYRVDPDLDYVEIVDTGDPSAGGDFWTTARYRVLDGGVETTYELPRDVYYWYLVHPILDCQEWVRRIHAPTGFSTVDGSWWRSFYYEDDAERNYTRPAVLTSPNDITTAVLASYDFGGAAAASVFSGPQRSMSVVVREPGSRVPVFIAFVHGDGRCCDGSYPNPDGQVFATTMPVEAAAAAGDDGLLENMILAGQGNRELRTDMLLSTNFSDTAPRKILVLRDRIPFDAAADENEAMLTSLGRAYDVLGSADLAALELVTAASPFVPSQYIKIIVPSDQPLALYQALGDNAARIEAFVDHGGVFELHGAVRAADDWTGIAMPFGLEALPMDGTHAVESVEVAGFPLLREVIGDTAFLWDREKVILPGERAYDPSEGAVAKIGWWVANNLPWRVQEMATWRRNAAVQRAVDPVRILFNHFANCGEIQDVYGAAMRTLLVPCALTATWADDHVWNEFYENDAWHPLQVDWSGSVTQIDNWGVAYDADTGGGKTVSGMVVTRPDCLVRNVLGRYEPVVSTDGIIESGDYSMYVTLRIGVTDEAGSPVDGARVMIATPGLYDPASLGFATTAFTGPDGVAAFTVGENNAYYYQIESPLGTLPDPDYVDRLATEEQTQEPGTVVERTVAYEGLDPDGRPFPLVPAVSASPAPYDPPPQDAERWAVSVGVAAGRELAYGKNYLMNDNSWMEPAGDGALSVYLMDEANYVLFSAREAPAAVDVAEGVSGHAFDIDLPVGGGTWYLVLASPGRVVNAQEVSVDISTVLQSAAADEPGAEEGEDAEAGEDAAGEEQVEEEGEEGDGPEGGNGEGCGCSIVR